MTVAADRMAAGTGYNRVENPVERTDFDFDFDNIEGNSVDAAEYMVEVVDVEMVEKAEREPDIGIDVGSQGQTDVVALDVAEGKVGLKPEADIEIDVG